MIPVKPKRLKPGDTVAVLSPSWGGPSLYPHVFDLGLRNLEDLFGLKVKEFPTARMANAEIYNNPHLRAEDINHAFRDPEVSAIIASIGGDDSVRILPFLDLEGILANPKILMGYSDTTTLTSYLNVNGLVTFNGPGVMSGFAQMRHLPPAFTEHVRTVLFDAPDTLTYQPYEMWSDRYQPWQNPGYDGEVKDLRKNEWGWHWIQGSGSVEGRLFGGCIEVLEFLKGTRFWPPEGFFKDKILFFETSEDKPPISLVKYFIRNYGSMGVLSDAKAILFGRARDYSDDEKIELEKMLVQIVAGEFGNSGMPIVTNVDFGHTEPQLVMPLGVRVGIDCQAKTITMLEPATS